MVLSLCWFRENRRRWARTVLINVKKITFARVRAESKERPGKFYVPHHDI